MLVLSPHAEFWKRFTPFEASSGFSFGSFLIKNVLNMGRALCKSPCLSVNWNNSFQILLNFADTHPQQPLPVAAPKYLFVSNFTVFLLSSFQLSLFEILIYFPLQSETHFREFSYDKSFCWWRQKVIILQRELFPSCLIIVLWLPPRWWSVRVGGGRNVSRRSQCVSNLKLNFSFVLLFFENN